MVSGSNEFSSNVDEEVLNIGYFKNVSPISINKSVEKENKKVKLQIIEEPSSKNIH